MPQVVENRKIISLRPNERCTPQIRKIRPNAKLTVSERAALRDLGRYVILTPDFFGLCAGYKHSESHAGLYRLFEKGLADRGFYCAPRTEEEIAQALPRVPQDLAYKLTTDGYKRGIRDGLIDASAWVIRNRWNGVAPDDMKHRLLIVELMIKTRMDLAVQSRLCLGRVIPDFVRKNNAKATKDNITKDRHIVPDLVMELETFSGAGSTLLFCEVENTKLQPCSNDKNRATIARKLKPYGDYLRSPHRKIRGGKQSIVLYVMNQPAAHLDEVIKHVPWDEVGDVAKLIRFTTFDDIREHGVLSGRWRSYLGETVRLVV